MFSGGGIFDSGKNSDSITDTDTTSYVNIGDIWTAGGGFNPQNMRVLFNMLGNRTGASFKEIEALGTKTAADIRTNTTGKTSSQDIVVTLGGLKWEVVYLSKDTDGNTILTLWLSNNKQSAWTSKSATEGAYYGFLSGGLYSNWSANWWDMSFTAQTYPSNMYGTSYIRAVTLNNGGKYAATKGASSLTTFSPTSSSVFANFTLSSSKLTKYIVKPNKVSWQLNQTARGSTANMSYDLPNDSLNNPTGANWYTNSSNGSSDMTGKTNYKDWGNDNIWLPSMAETGYDATYSGLWKVSVSQRQNGDGTSTSSLGSVGKTSGSAYPYSWLRSGYYSYAYWSYNLYPSGSDRSSIDVRSSGAVRPAFHLNLSAVAEDCLDWTFFPDNHFEGGTGAKNNPYLIATPEQLALMSCIMNFDNDGHYSFKLVNDIDLRGHYWMPAGYLQNCTFSGLFDGDNHKIFGINIDTSKGGEKMKCAVGLFCSVTSATITQVTLEGSIINSFGTATGGIAGEGTAGINNCNVNANIMASNSPAGGLIGVLHGGIIDACSFTGNVFGKATIGGIAGVNESGNTLTIANCNVSADIICNDNSAGGIIGNGKSCSIHSCTFKGNIQGDNGLGGIIGYLTVGEVTHCTVEATIISASTSGTCIGGIIGILEQDGQLNACIADVVVSGKTYVSSIIGQINVQSSIISIAMCAGYGRILETNPDTGFGGCLVGSSNADIEFVGCSYVGIMSSGGDSSFLLKGSFFVGGKSYSTSRGCYMKIILNDFTSLFAISNDANDTIWGQMYAIVNNINNNLPIQRELYAIADAAVTTPEDFEEAFKEAQRYPGFSS